MKVFRLSIAPCIDDLVLCVSTNPPFLCFSISLERDQLLQLSLPLSSCPYSPYFRTWEKEVGLSSSDASFSLLESEY